MKKILAFITAALAITAGAQQLQVATGSASGTYSTMFKQLAQQCAASGIPLIEKNTSGTPENVDMLVGNQINAAFVQPDVLYLRARTEDLGNIKTLLALHTETVHVVTKADAGYKEGGVMGVGAKTIPFTTVEQLAGRTIGAYGGSLVTAQVIRLQSEIAFQVVPFDNEAALKEALAKEKVDAGLFVGGQPLGTVASLGAGYKILAMAPATVEKLKGVYKPVRLNYRQMNAAGVPSVGMEALFVTREYKTEKMTSSLAALRACALNSLDGLKETTGTHPAWQSVDASNKGKWAWYELPAKK